MARKKTEKTVAESPEVAVTPVPAQKPGRGRKPKGKATETQEKPTTQTQEPVQSPEVQEKEQMLCVKHGEHRIVPGSLRTAGGREGFSHKWTVIITCVSCEAERVVATSDLQWWSTKYCPTCAKAVKKNRKDTEKAKKSLK